MGEAKIQLGKRDGKLHVVVTVRPVWATKLKLWLPAEGGFEVTLCGADYLQATDAARADGQSIVVLEESVLMERSGDETAAGEEVKRIVVILGADSRWSMAGLRARGAMGFVEEGRLATELALAVCAVSRGEAWVSQGILERALPSVLGQRGGKAVKIAAPVGEATRSR